MALICFSLMIRVHILKECLERMEGREPFSSGGLDEGGISIEGRREGGSQWRIWGKIILGRENSK